jgi:hypothetical protein
MTSTFSLVSDRSLEWLTLKSSASWRKLTRPVPIQERYALLTQVVKTWFIRRFGE